jgi:hypothetical protein
VPPSSETHEIQSSLISSAALDMPASPVIRRKGGAAARPSAATSRRSLGYDSPIGRRAAFPLSELDGSHPMQEFPATAGERASV